MCFEGNFRKLSAIDAITLFFDSNKIIAQMYLILFCKHNFCFGANAFSIIQWFHSNMVAARLLTILLRIAYYWLSFVFSDPLLDSYFSIFRLFFLFWAFKKNQITSSCKLYQVNYSRSSKTSNYVTKLFLLNFIKNM